MQIFLDTAALADVERWMGAGVVDGVTTNPSIMLRAGVVDAVTHAARLAHLLGERPLSLEVTTNDRGEMLHEARSLSSIARNVVVKVPIINDQGEDCLQVVHALVRAGIRVNVTACMSFPQVMLAAKAGATYASLFAGRIADEGHDAPAVIVNCRRWIDMWRSETKIIVASIRGAIDVQQAALSGAHVVTVPPALMQKLLDHKFSRFTAAEFVRDAQRAGAERAGV